MATAGTLAAGAALLNPFEASAGSLFSGKGKTKVALVGTGIRGITFWGKSLVDKYSDSIEFVGLCDTNPGRLAYAKGFIGVTCPTFTNFDEMLAQAKPDMLMVTTVDATHHEFIIKGLKAGIKVLTEKPLTTEAAHCESILKAEKEAGNPIIVGFNYRYNPHYTKIKELLQNQRVGKITSVDFHWYLNTYHGADYFRRWHGQREKSGTLLVHKSTHHFDLLNWWLDSDPVEVTAIGALDHYGKNNAFRGKNCRNCPHTAQCKYYYDITKSDMYMKLYVANEGHDGYIRDNCLWREEINIYDKMSVQVKYANGVVVNYSLTTYSPYEGMTIAFNGKDGRLDAWDGIPWRKQEKLNQAELHAKEMSQSEKDQAANFEEIMVSDNFGETEAIKVVAGDGGHGGGDKRLHDRIFVAPDAPDPLFHAAGLRDGIMSCIVGVAARQSIETGKTVRIDELTSVVPEAVRPKK